MNKNDDDYSHYHFMVSLRVRHPDKNPEVFTQEFGIKPENHWKAGEPRRTPKGTPLDGQNKDTYWTANVIAGKWPDLALNAAIAQVLRWMSRHRSFLHKVRSEGGSTELFVGWFFHRQSGDVISYDVLQLAGDLQIDLSLDVYPPAQPQQVCPVDPLPT